MLGQKKTYGRPGTKGLLSERERRNESYVQSDARRFAAGAGDICSVERTILADSGAKEVLPGREGLLAIMLLFTWSTNSLQPVVTTMIPSTFPILTYLVAMRDDSSVYVTYFTTILYL